MPSGIVLGGVPVKFKTFETKCLSVQGPRGPRRQGDNPSGQAAGVQGHEEYRQCEG